ncbi:MAG: cereblon family protein [Myxococcota bacterium]|nr:cereblon family protein [Myxococcota bacterium]
MAGQGLTASFVNPGGFVHEVLTTRNAPGCLPVGAPVRADTWFPGYTWRFALCGRCTGFVGWAYDAVSALDPVRFWGLRSAAVRED